MITVKTKKLEHYDSSFPLPSYETKGAAGADVRASLGIGEKLIKKPGQRVLVVDDLLATGGTIASTIQLIEKLGGVVVGTAFLIELLDLKGRDKIKGYDIFTLLEY